MAIKMYDLNFNRSFQVAGIASLLTNPLQSVFFSGALLVIFLRDDLTEIDMT